jgi:5-methylcytosine-specific restriction protein A
MTWDTSDRRRRLPANWPQLVRQVKNRDGHRCTWHDNGQRCIGPADEVDHVLNNDDHRLSNLRSLCKPHHAKKSAAEGVAARRSRRRPTEPHPGLSRKDNGRETTSGH